MANPSGYGKPVKFELREEMDPDYGPVIRLFIDGEKQDRTLKAGNDPQADMLWLVKGAFIDMRQKHNILMEKATRGDKIASLVRSLVKESGL